MHLGKLWCWISVVFITVPGFAPASIFAQTGGDAGAFLRLGMGTRALGMGSAFTGVANDGSSVYWNPAGLGFGEPGRRFNIMSRRMPLDRNQTAMSFSMGLKPGGGIGFTWIRFGVDNIDARDLNGQPQGTISDSENALLFSFSPKIHEKVSIGVSMKVLLYRLAGQSAKGFGGDIGILVQLMEPLTLGLMFRDMGTRISWNTSGLFRQNVRREESYPRSLTLGAGYRLWDRRILLSADLETVQRVGSKFRIGTEVDIVKGLHLRTGLNHGQFAAGLGFATSIKSIQQRFHYVFLTDRIGLNETHVFEWEIGF